MAEGVDYSFSRPDPAGLRAAGKTFCCRYLSPPPSGKNLDRQEADRLRAAGLLIVSNWEADGHQELLAGRSSGQSAARQAQQQHLDCGGPPTVPIYFSADFDAQVSQVIEFYRGAVDILGYDRVGCYGGFAVVEGLVGSVVRWGWQTFAWSGGRRSGKAHIYQHTVDVPLAGGQVDLDTSLQAAFGQWGSGMTVQSELDRFIAQNTGRCLDLDGAYGCQCRDLVNAWAEFLGLPQVPGPNAVDMWGHPSASGWQKIAAGATPQPGDILVWGQLVGSYGHTAVYVRAGSGGFFSFDQNWPEGSSMGSAAKLIWHTSYGLLGWFRPQVSGAAPSPAPTEPTLEEEDMPIVLFGPGGAMLVAPGYQKGLTAEEYAAVLKVPGTKVVSCDQRQFDVLGSAFFNGRLASSGAKAFALADLPKLEGTVLEGTPPKEAGG